MVLIPPSGMLRELSIGLEVLLVVLCFQFFFIFMLRARQRERRGATSEAYVTLSWAILLLALGITFLDYLIADYWVDPAIRDLVLRAGYLSASIGLTVCLFLLEKGIAINTKYVLTILGAVQVVIMVVADNWLVRIVAPFFYPVCVVAVGLFYYDYWRQVEGTVRKNAAASSVALLSLMVGYALSCDICLNAFGFPIRVVADLIMVVAVVVLTISIYSLPSIASFEWFRTLREIYVLTRSGKLMVHEVFGFTPKARQESRDMLVAGGIAGVVHLVRELFESNRHIKAIDHGDLKILFDHGQHIICVIVADEDLPILHEKLARYIRLAETQYPQLISEWTGDAATLDPLHRLIDEIFYP